MTPTVHEAIHAALRRHRGRRLVEALPILAAAALGLALLVRIVARHHAGLAGGAGAMGLAALAGWAAWRAHQRRGSLTGLAARADHLGETHALLVTGLSVESGEVTGRSDLAQAELAQARQAAPGLLDAAVPPVRLAWPPILLAAGLLVLHATSGQTWAPGPLRGAPATALADAGAGQTPGPTGGADPAGEDRFAAGGVAPEAAPAPEGRKRGATGSSGEAPDAPDADDGPTTAPASEATGDSEAAAGDGIDPLAKAVSLWSPDGRNVQSSGQLGNPGRQDASSGDRAVDPTGDGAAVFDDQAEAAGGQPGDGASEDDARADLATVTAGEGPADEDADGEPEGDGEPEAAPGEGGEDADNPDDPQDQSRAPPENLAGADEELGRGDESAGAAGAGGANDAGGSAPSEAQKTPPDWAVAAEQVAGVWRDAPVATLQQIADGRTGRRSGVAWQTLTRDYAALAEAETTPEQVPPTRRAYVQRYFDALAAPDEEPPDDR